MSYDPLKAITDAIKLGYDLGRGAPVDLTPAADRPQLKFITGRADAVVMGGTATPTPTVPTPEPVLVCAPGMSRCDSCGMKRVAGAVATITLTYLTSPATICWVCVNRHFGHLFKLEDE